MTIWNSRKWQMQRGPMTWLSALDLCSGGPEFKSSYSLLQGGFELGGPNFNSSMHAF